MFPPKEWPRLQSRMYAFRILPGATKAMEIQPGRPYVLRFWLDDGSDWSDMASLVPSVATAMPLAEAPYYVEVSLIPVPGVEAGLSESAEVTFTASAPVLVISHAAAGGTELLGALTPVTQHD